MTVVVGAAAAPTPIAGEKKPPGDPTNDKGVFVVFGLIDAYE